MEPYWDLIERIIKESDLILEILDARLVDLSRNEKVEELAKEIGRPLIFVVNKSDLVDNEILKKKVGNLRKDGEVIFVSSKKRYSEKIIYSTIRKVFNKFGKSEKEIKSEDAPKPKYKSARGKIIVGVVGYPNVGKSSLINLLSHKTKVKVSKKAGTTHGIHWIKASKDILLIDSPGVIPLEKEDEIRYGLLGARDSSRLKNSELVADAIIKLFMKENKKGFEDFYKIKIEQDDYQSVVDEIARKNHYLLKAGMLDENKACQLIVKDWQQGNLRL
jgi:ribosome biogenesis GTPase A